jgi:hypothetical protein
MLKNGNKTNRCRAVYLRPARKALDDGAQVTLKDIFSCLACQIFHID